MSNSFSRGMTRAAELTQSGKLTEATALIQSLLQTGPAANSTTADDGVIEGTCTDLGDIPAPPAKRARAPRRGLGETLRGLAADARSRHGITTPTPVDLPNGAHFLSLSHDSAEGSRDYRLYIPAARSEGPMPLIVMLHGCTQSPEDFAVGTGMNALAEESGCLVAWPAQPQGANVQKCWNWFRPEDQAHGRGEPALIAGIVADILRDHPADSGRIYVAGLSAGGAAAAIMGAAYPDLVAAIGVHSGLPVGAAQDVPTALAAMRGGARGNGRPVATPTIVFHGLADATVHPGNGAAVVAQALQARSRLARVQHDGVSDGGRAYRQTRHVDTNGRSMTEHWEIEGAGHAWAGGQSGGSHTDPRGPDASREMLRFFLRHARV